MPIKSHAYRHNLVLHPAYDLFSGLIIDRLVKMRSERTLSLVFRVSFKVTHTLFQPVTFLSSAYLWGDLGG